MHKIALGIAVATLAALFQNHAGASTLRTSASLRVAIDASQPVEDVTYYGYGYRRGYRAYRPYYGYRPYYRRYAYRPYYGYRPYYRSYGYGY